MPTLDFHHLRNKLAAAFPDDPILGLTEPATQPLPMPFIVGVPGSGTALLRWMMDAHPDLAMAPDNGLVLSIVERPNSAGPLSPLELHRLATRAPGWPDLAVDPSKYRAALTAMHPFSVSEGLRALYRLYAGRLGKPRRGDESPMTIQSLRAIAEILPEARFIHVIRDGRDVAVALRETRFAPGRDLTSLGRCWSELIRHARHEADRAVRCLEIRYEALVQDTERTLREICAFVDLAFDPDMLLHQEEARRRPASPTPPDDRIGRWRTEMTSAERAELEVATGGLLQELGYL